MADLKGLRFDPQTLILLGIILALLGVGYLAGNHHGKQSVEQQLIEQGPQSETLTGTVKKINDEGFTLETDSGKWKVKYAKSAGGAMSGAGIGGPGSSGSDQGIKEGDKVQVNGTKVSKKTVVSQSVTKQVEPTPGPESTPANLP